MEGFPGLGTLPPSTLAPACSCLRAGATTKQCIPRPSGQGGESKGRTHRTRNHGARSPRPGRCSLPLSIASQSFPGRAGLLLHSHRPALPCPGPEGPPEVCAGLQLISGARGWAHVLCSRLRPEEAVCRLRANLGEPECAERCYLGKAAGTSHLNSFLCHRSHQAEACLVYRMKVSHCVHILPEPSIKTNR